MFKYLGLQSTATMPTSLATTASAAVHTGTVPAISIDEIANGVQQLKVDREINEGNRDIQFIFLQKNQFLTKSFILNQNLVFF